MACIHRKQLAYNVHFQPRQAFIAYGAGVGQQVDIVKKGLPPIGINLYRHSLLLFGATAGICTKQGLYFCEEVPKMNEFYLLKK
jgi:hypothetical protein